MIQNSGTNVEIWDIEICILILNADRLALLLLCVLGLLPSLQCSIHISPRKKNANQGKVSGNVPAFFLLPSENSWRPAIGAWSPNCIRVDYLLDGWA